MNLLSGARKNWRRLASAATALLLTLAGSAAYSRTSAGAATTPGGFTDLTVWSGLTRPTAIAFAPDGRIFVAEKSGLIKVFASRAAAQPTVFADLRAVVYDFSDRGLLGLATDPALGQSGHNYIYVLYTYDAPPGRTAPVWNDQCPSPPGANTDGCVVTIVLSRIPVSPDGSAGAEQRIIGPAWCQQFTNHSAGHLAFAPDGTLYVSAGDGASFTDVDYGQYGGTLAGTPTPANPCGDPPGRSGTALTSPTARGGALRALSPRRPAGEPLSLDGAVLRVNPATGAGVPGNPTYSSSNPRSNASRIYAYGFRNPFRFAIRPANAEVWVGDVGWHTWEEIDRLPKPPTTVASNSGWPCYEGAGKQAGYAALDLCEALYADTTHPATAPYYTYNHSSALRTGDTCPAGGSSISGLAFSNSPSYPSAYAGALFFADYARNCIWVMFAGTNGLPDPSTIRTFVDDSDNPYPVDLEVDPQSGDLFYVNIGGSIHRIIYGSNQPPTAKATATPTYGAAPLAVQFDAGQSSDPDPGDKITYSWDLNGDGTFGDSTAVRPTYTYSAGRYTAVLRVSDSHGATSSRSITISSGNTPPRPVIDSPSPSLTWAVGDQINFSAHANDDEDGTEPASRFSWQLLLYHCPSNCHTHFLQTWNGVASGSFSAPDHDYPSYLVLQLTVTDAGGLSRSTSVRLDPRTTTLNFATTPSGLQLVVDGTSQTTPFSRTVIVNSTHSISAPSPQALNGRNHAFVSWSDGGAKAHSITARESTTSYRAVFTPPV